METEVKREDGDVNYDEQEQAVLEQQKKIEEEQQSIIALEEKQIAREKAQEARLQSAGDSFNVSEEDPYYDLKKKLFGISHPTDPLGEHDILEVIGKGASGCVYSATNKESMLVALKG
eukprot:Pgem_evm1s10302